MVVSCGDLPVEGGVVAPDYEDILQQASVPESVRRDTEWLLGEMQTIAEDHATLAVTAEGHIATLMSWVTVASQALQIAQTLVPVAAAALKAKGAAVTPYEQECWLKQLLGDPQGLLNSLKSKLPS